MSLNCQSLDPKIERLMDIVDNKKLDLLLLTETWLTKRKYKSARAKLNSFSFKIFFSDKVGRGRGNAIVLKNTVAYKKVELNKYNHFSTFDIIMVLLDNPEATSVFCIYRYYRFGAAFDSFITEFSQFLSEVAVNCNSYVLCGDFNVHVNISTDTNTVKFMDLLEEFDLHLVSPIVPTQRCGNTLDLIICDSRTKTNITAVSVENHHLLLSDHFPVFFNLNDSTSNSRVNNDSVSLRRHYRKINSGQFSQDLTVTLSNKCNPSCAVFQHALDDYNSALQYCIDKHAPLTPCKVVHSDRPPWMDAEYVAARAKRRRFERAYKHSGSLFDKRCFQIQSKLCSDMVNEKRSKHLKQQIMSQANNQRGLFNLINNLAGKSKTTSLPEIYGDYNTLANEFNIYFINKIASIRNDFISDMDDSIFDFIDNFDSHSSVDPSYLSEFTPTSVEELISMIEKSGIKVSPADILPAHLVNENIDLLLPYINTLINLSLSTGNIEGLKKAIVRPQLKDHNIDHNYVPNFRPVSNLLFLGKLIERVVQDRLQKHLDFIGYCNNTQFGYKKNHSTELLLLKFVNDILVGVDSKNGVVVLLIDLSAAFDTVDHRKLLNILFHELKITGTALKWFKSFLCHRSQSVLTGSCYSETFELTCGVPQGSVLGPILFNLYVNSLSNIFVVNGFNTLSYADDNSGYQVFSLSSESYIFNDLIPNFIDQIKSWMQNFFLKINEDKTQIIVFSRPTLGANFQETQVTLNNGEEILITDKIKYLGFHFDRFLSFTSHVNKIVSHCYQLLNTVRQLRKYLTQTEVETLVHSIITSRVDYCNSLFFGAQKTNCIMKLQRLQNSASKIVLRKGRLQGCPSGERLNILHWLTVEKRIVFKVLVIIYGCFIGTAPVLVSSLLQRKFPSSTIDDDFNCDFDDRLYYPVYSIGRRAFIFYAPRMWNALPIDIRSSVNKDIFKNKLKTYLWSSYDELMRNFNRYRNM